MKEPQREKANDQRPEREMVERCQTEGAAFQHREIPWQAR